MRPAALIILLGAIGCGANEPTTNPADLNGSYIATTFTIALQGAQTKDILAAGGSVNLQISPGQTTAGRLVIPASVGGPIDDNLAGTYRVIGKTNIQYVALGTGIYIDGYTFTSDPPELRAFVSLLPPNAGAISLILRKQ